MPRILGCSETLVDFVFRQNDGLYRAVPGGSLFNATMAAAANAPSSVETALLSVAGDDRLGTVISETLRSVGCSTLAFALSSRMQTPLSIAVPTMTSTGTEYVFYREPTDRNALKKAFSAAEKIHVDILLAGSFFALSDETHTLLLALLAKLRARNPNLIFIYDPNFRRPHLPDRKKLLPRVGKLIAQADIVKGSDEDFGLLWDAVTFRDAWRKILECQGKKRAVPLLFYTRNRAGATCFDGRHAVTASISKGNEWLGERIRSTIGAGDSFTAGIALAVAQPDVAEDLTAMLKNGVRFGTAACLTDDNWPTPTLVTECQEKLAIGTEEEKA